MTSSHFVSVAGTEITATQHVSAGDETRFGAGRAAAKFRNWMTECALPLSLTVGFDDTLGWFRDRIPHSRKPAVDPSLRLMPQARQIALYSHATLIGWIDARSEIEFAFEQLLRFVDRDDQHQGLPNSFSRGGDVVDDRRDLMTHSSVIEAAAFYYRVTEDPRAVVLASMIVNFIEENMRIRVGGYSDQWPNCRNRPLQRPQAAMFSALLALYEATNRATYLELAGRILSVVTSRFLIAERGIIVEHLNSDWKPLYSHLAPWRPRQQFLWVWLLDWYQRLSGISTEDLAWSLYETTYRDAVKLDGEILQELRADGSVSKRGHHASCFAEAVKANAVLFRAAQPVGAVRATVSLQGLLRHHLPTRRKGIWHDELNLDFSKKNQFSESENLYDLFLAAMESTVSFLRLSCRAEVF